MLLDLLDKYNVPVPRYTSYPTVPMWDNNGLNINKWQHELRKTINDNDSISLYIHLPYCESLCTYCGCHKYITKNHGVEEPYIGAILKEWSLYVQALGAFPKIKEIHLGGGTPTFFSANNLERLISGILKLSAPNDRCEMSFEAHPSSTNYEHLRILRDIGFNRLSIGVQDFDADIMKTIHRFQTVEQIETLTQQARDLNYDSINYDLIYGLPGQSLEHIKANMEKLQSLKPDRIAFYSYAHIPSVKPGQRAYGEKDLLMGKEKLALYELGRKLMLEMGYSDIGMDHFSLKSDSLFKSMKKKILHRNFMGYTTTKTDLSIGLGASAISESRTAYAQNEKSVKEYIRKMKEETKLPIFKNHFLTVQDVKVKQHILNLICQLETHWLHGESSEIFDNNLELQELENDGLIKLFPKQIKVTPKGRNFIRNICKAIDMRMKSGSSTPVFSKAV